MNIDSRAKYPARALSNLAPNVFVFDGILCASMEGFLQALKFEEPHLQVGICRMAGIEAQRRGKERDGVWQKAQKLWWRGQVFERDSQDYQGFLDRAYDALANNSGFRRALRDSGMATLTHSVGKSKQSETVLTEDEFIFRLTKIRARLLSDS